MEPPLETQEPPAYGVHQVEMATPTEEQPTLNGLAKKIQDLTQSLTESLENNDVAPCTFAVDSPATYATASPEIFMMRQTLIETLQDMIYLTQGPNESIFNYAHSVIPDAACLNILNYFNFWDAVPLNSSASYTEIAKHVNLPQDVVERILKHATSLRIFSETEPGKRTTRIQHSFRSAPLARSKGLQGLVATTLDVSGAPMMAMPQALEKYSAGKSELTGDINETAFALLHQDEAYGKFANTWDMLEHDGSGAKKGWRQRQFTDFMEYIKEIFSLENVVSDSFDWASIGDATVVDIAGSAGVDAFHLATKFPALRIIVQDLAQVAPVFDKNHAEVSADLQSRVSFMEHDMFEPQPVSADIYLIKQILHDWPDAEAVKVLRALIPALKPGARVILVEYIGSKEDEEGGEEEETPRILRGMGSATDLRIMALFNTKERPVGAWKQIFTKADERFEVKDVKAEKTAFYAVVEAVWRG